MEIDEPTVDATITNIEDAMKRRRRQQIAKIVAKVAIVTVPIVAVVYFLTKDNTPEPQTETTEQAS